ncbi:tetratricopeptide repeat protein [Geodermatophilus ruber]|nr:tetratricopeptide repeat protein [Geodermatophilus ruber]
MTSGPTRGPGLPGEEDVFRATGVRASHLSPIPRAGVLPPHHPGRGCADHSGYPYPLWSGGLLPEPEPGRPGEVRLRGRHLEATVDLAHGGRLLELVTWGGAGLSAVAHAVMDGRDARGTGLRGGVEWNPSRLRRSPLALEPVHATVSLPDRLGGDRLRWWELERAGGYLCQVDLHLPDGAPVLLVAVRQTPLTSAVDGAEPGFTMLVDDARWGGTGDDGSATILTGAAAISVFGDITRHTDGDSTGAEPVARPANDGQVVRWLALAVAPVDSERLAALVPAVLAGLEDPAPADGTGQVGTGSAWAGLEVVRARERGTAVPVVPAATPVREPAEPADVAARLRGVPEQQWLHLFRDEGLGTSDRVHPGDVGHPVGHHWLSELRRAHRRESLGDWRVHLRLGDIAFLDGDLREAHQRWSWSHALRPTVWTERNLALVDLAAGRIQDAAVRLLRAHRIDPQEVELGVEAVGCLLGAARVQDCTVVLDRMAVRAQDSSARYWLLRAEVALRSAAGEQAHAHLEEARRCPDGKAFEPWCHSIAESLRT